MSYLSPFFLFRRRRRRRSARSAKRKKKEKVDFRTALSSGLVSRSSERAQLLGQRAERAPFEAEALEPPERRDPCRQRGDSRGFRQCEAAQVGEHDDRRGEAADPGGSVAEKSLSLQN